MALNSINEFTITPTAVVQLILGTNGCGKSSLIRELTPLPPNQNDYHKDGYKTIVIYNRGITYTLKSTFSPPRHSFMKEDEELNPGYTVTVFKDLVKQEFGITTDIHNLLIGNELFHSMSAVRRREWLTLLSDVSYDYAMDVYGKLKERLRDVNGALKLANKRLVTETAKLISPDEEKKLRQEADLTLKELNLLIERSAPLDNPVDFYKSQQIQLTDELYRLSNILLRMKCVEPYGTHVYGFNPTSLDELDDTGTKIRYGFKSVEEIEDYIDTLSHDITRYETIINTNVTEHTKIKETIDILVRTGEDGVKPLYDKIAGYKQAVINIQKQLKVNLDISNPENAMKALESIYSTLIDLFITIPDNFDKRYSNANLNTFRQNLVTYKEKRLAIIEGLTKLNNLKLHLETHKNAGSIKCPKCSHSWILGYSEESYNKTLTDISNKEKELADINLLIEKTEKSIQEINEYIDQYRIYLNCSKTWTILNPLWEHINQSENIFNNPRSLTSLIDNFRADLESMIQVSHLNDEINSVSKLIQEAEKVGNANLLELKNKLAYVSEVISNKTSALSKTQQVIANYKKYRLQLIEAKELSVKISEMIENINLVNTDMIEMMRRETLNHCVRQLQNSLALKETTLSSINLQKGIVNDLQEQIEKLKIENESVNLLLRELSPTTGIIAEGLIGFIRTFINQMNLMIKKIWAYPLIIQDCSNSETEGSDLDYEFPLIVGNKTNIVSDIKLGSTGMLEIINLAFKVVAMKYLGLSESPLYLDEFGKTLDKEHISLATATIKSLMGLNPFTQLFFVSHHDVSYGSFNNAEVCVLDSRNVTVPSVYNEHVVIK